MRPGADRDAGAVDDGGYIMRMGALHLERHDRTLVPCGAENAQRIDFAQPLMGIIEEIAFVRPDALPPDRGDIVDGGAKSDRLHDRRRTGFEFVRRLAVCDLVQEYFA